MLNIIVEQRKDDYIAFIHGSREVWESGHSSTEAIGNLIISLYQNGDKSVMITFRGE